MAQAQPIFSVSDSEYQAQEELLFRTAARLRGLLFYRLFVLLALPVVAWLYQESIGAPAWFWGAFGRLMATQLLRIASDYIGGKAAKKVADRSRLFDFEDDRHVGQILVRYLNRREDVTYLERLSARSRHVEVRSAAQVQLARLWRRLDAPGSPPPGEPPSSAPPRPAPPGPAGVPDETATSAAVEREGVDGSLLGWAAHFVVEHAWSHLGTAATRELLVRTRRELMGRHPSLVFFEVSTDAHVAVNLEGGLRLPGDAVAAAAAWVAAFRAEARATAPDLEVVPVRALTALVADALRDTGFYAACDVAEAKGLPPARAPVPAKHRTKLKNKITMPVPRSENRLVR